MAIDLTDDAAGRATAFATACAGTWVFIRNLVMKPAIKSCHAQIAEIREMVALLKIQVAQKDARIGDLELALFMHGNGAMRSAMQAAISENHVELDEIKQQIGVKP